MAQGITQVVEVEKTSSTRAFKARITVTETYDISTNASNLAFSNFQVAAPGVTNGTMYVFGTIQLIANGTVIDTLFNVASGTGRYSAYREGANWATLSWSKNVNNIAHGSDGKLTVTMRFSGFHAYGLSNIPGPINQDVEIVLTAIPRGERVFIDTGVMQEYDVYIDTGVMQRVFPHVDTNNPWN